MSSNAKMLNRQKKEHLTKIFYHVIYFKIHFQQAENDQGYKLSNSRGREIKFRKAGV